MLNHAEKHITASLCRSLLTTYSGLLESVIDEIKKEQDIPINLPTSDEIALEYKRRQGIKEGLLLLTQKLNSKANERHN